MSNSSSILAQLPLGAPLEIFTDGSCLGNPGPCGWGVVLVRDGRVVHKHSAGLCAQAHQDNSGGPEQLESLRNLPP